MSTPTPSNAPRTSDILAQAVGCLYLWDEGKTLQEIIPRGPTHDLMQNGLFTLFRRRAAIDWILSRLIQRPPRPRLRRLLQWAVCDYLYLHGVPPQVLADQCVDHVKNSGNHSESGFVNAVLRKLMQKTQESWLNLAESANAPAAVRLGLSPELVAAWQPHLAAEQLAELATLLQTPAPLVVRLRAGSGSGDCQVPVGGDSEIPSPGTEPPHRHTATPPHRSPLLRPLPAPDFASGARIFEVVVPGAFFASAEFRRGDYYVQDPSTLLAPAMLDVKPGEAVADLCCAPGGKSLLLAEALWCSGNLKFETGNSGEKMPDHASLGNPELQLGQSAAAAVTDLHGLTRTDTDGRNLPAPVSPVSSFQFPASSLLCADRSEARLERVRENLAGFAGVGKISYAVADAAHPPFPPASFDAVLLDVPCSNTGVIRRRPDVRWRFTRANLRELVELQAAILRGAAALVRPGGRLVYSTCSIEPQENADQVCRFLAEHAEFALAAERQLLPAAAHDGAYAALLVRKG